MVRGFRAALPALLVWVAAATVYVAVLGPRATDTSGDRHFVHLANSFLNGQFGVVNNQPLGQNDWACFDRVAKDACPPGQFSFSDPDRYRWYVSFPPFPAVLLLPFVAIFGTGVWDRAIWGVLAGAGPAALFFLFETLRARGLVPRTRYENVFLTSLFAFGSVYFFTAVQGTVWFAAHVVAVPLTVLYVLFALDAKRPLLAGMALGLAFMTRPTTLFLAPFALLEVCRVSRGAMVPLAAGPVAKETHWLLRALRWFQAVSWREAAVRGGLFLLPLIAVGTVAMAMNHTRFLDPFEFGHRFLQIYWRDRIERWGLFNYHYLPKNLAVFVTAMPWLSALPPYVMISRHGLALWFTTPQLLTIFFPKSPYGAREIGLGLSVACVALLNLAYQNSGWVQFGYRFALDYLPLLFVLMAVGGRRFGPGWHFLWIFAVAINTFGALTFDRQAAFYDTDATQNVIFQPD